MLSPLWAIGRAIRLPMLKWNASVNVVDFGRIELVGERSPYLMVRPPLRLRFVCLNWIQLESGGLVAKCLGSSDACGSTELGGLVTWCSPFGVQVLLWPGHPLYALEQQARGKVSCNMSANIHCS